MRLSTAVAIVLSLVFFSAWPARGETPAPVVSAAPSPAATSWGNVQTLTFTACNESANPLIFIAIAYPEEKNETSRGWWSVKKSECTEVGTFPIDHKAFGIYADAREGRYAPETKAWGGPAQYCINLKALFTLKGAARKGGGLCPELHETRGFVQVTPALLFPSSPDRQNDQNLSFKYTFR